MPHHTRRFNPFCRGALSFLVSGLLVGSLSSCSGSSSSSNGDSTGSQATLTLSPSTIQVTAGAASQPASLLLTAPAGTGAVTVAVSGLPSGVTVSPATLSVTPGVALPLTFTAASSAAATMAMVTFTASANGQSVSTQASLSIQAAPPRRLLAQRHAGILDLDSQWHSRDRFSAGNSAERIFFQRASGDRRFATGVTVQPSSLTLTPGTAATLTLTAPAGTTAGSATATLTGTSGALTHTASLAVTVTAPPPAQADFSLAVSPQSLNVTIGGAGQPVQLTATALNGFTGNVNVALSGLPAGVTANPASVSLTPGTPQSVTLTAGNSAQAGSANAVFTGTSGSLTHAATLALTVTVSAGVNVTTYHNDNARDGWNAAETVLTPQNVNVNGFGKLRELPVDGKVDGQPLYVSSLSIAGQTHNVLIVVTEHGSAYAFDADSGRNCGR